MYYIPSRKGAWIMPERVNYASHTQTLAFLALSPYWEENQTERDVAVTGDMSQQCRTPVTAKFIFGYIFEQIVTLVRHPAK